MVGVVGVPVGVGDGLDAEVAVVGLGDPAPWHVTLKTVALIASYSRARDPQETSMLAPAAT